MAASTDFLLAIDAKIAGAAEAQTELEELMDSVAAGKKSYQELEKASANVGKALDKLGSKAVEEQAKLDKALELGDVKGADKARAALGKVTEKQQELEKQAHETKSALDKEGAALSKLADKASMASKNVKQPFNAGKTLEGLQKLPGPLKDLAGAGKDALEGLGGLGTGMGAAVLGAGLLAMGVMKVASAMTEAAIAAAKYTLELALQNRESKLTLQAMTGSAEAGKELYKSFGEITKSTGITGDRLTSLTRDLQKAHVSAEDLPVALKALAMQEQALGDSGGTADLIKNLEEGKTTVGAMASEMEDKFGTVVEEKMKGVDQQVTVLKQNFSDMIDGLNLEPLLNGLQKLIGLLDGTTETGQAMKLLFDNFFDTLSDSIGGGNDMWTTFEGIVLDVLIAGVKLDTAYAKLDKTFQKLGLGKLVDFKPTIDGITVAVELLSSQVDMVSGAFDGLSSSADMNGAAFDSLTETMDEWVTAAGGAMDDAIEKVKSKLTEWYTIGKDMMKGLIKGIKAMTSEVGQAAADAAEEAQNATKKKNDSHSPSRVYEDEGHNTMDGYILGILDRMPAMNDAMEMMLSPDVEPMDTTSLMDSVSFRPMAEPKARQTVQPITVTNNFYGVKDAEESVEKIEVAMTRIFEGRASQVGARARRRRAQAA